ncbi:MAG: hypothetical protein QOE19_3273, partial [Actinomycetota bacterium]|nr:hypothetical protein [Actinomycetota bacterium]
TVAGRDRGPRGRWALLRRRPGRRGAEVLAAAENAERDDPHEVTPHEEGTPPTSS